MLRADFTTLAGAAALCGGQADHVARIKSYVSDVCDRPEAFRGVLNVFQGSYGKGINAALAGLQSSVQIGDTMSSELRAAREDFIEADLAAHRRMRTVMQGVAAVAPYQLPEGGDDYTRGGTPPPRRPGRTEELDGLDGGDYGDAARDHGLRDTQRETDQPRWAKSHQDRFSDWWDERTDKYGDEGRVDDNARDRQRDGARDAGERARDEARRDGATRAEARDHGKDVRKETNDDHRRFNEGRDTGGRTGAHANDLYNEVKDIRENLKDLGEHADNIRENHQQAGRLDEFRGRDEDNELHEWGSR